MGRATRKRRSIRKLDNKINLSLLTDHGLNLTDDLLNAGRNPKIEFFIDRKASNPPILALNRTVSKNKSRNELTYFERVTLPNPNVPALRGGASRPSEMTLRQKKQILKAKKYLTSKYKSNNQREILEGNEDLKSSGKKLPLSSGSSEDQTKNQFYDIWTDDVQKEIEKKNISSAAAKIVKCQSDKQEKKDIIPIRTYPEIVPGTIGGIGIDLAASSYRPDERDHDKMVSNAVRKYSKYIDREEKKIMILNIPSNRNYTNPADVYEEEYESNDYDEEQHERVPNKVPERITKKERRKLRMAKCKVNLQKVAQIRKNRETDLESIEKKHEEIKRDRKKRLLLDQARKLRFKYVKPYSMSNNVAKKVGEILPEVLTREELPQSLRQLKPSKDLLKYTQISLMKKYNRPSRH